MDVADLLARAEAMVPDDVVNDAGVTAADVREYLDHGEWEIALDLLADLHTDWRPPTVWWDLLIVRAELRLLSPVDGGRQTPIPREGIVRPLWDVGRRTPARHRTPRSTGHSSNPAG
ncbi:hypothetical protein ACIA5A_19470 [Micromonospora sp. NPDC051300]|uniref:hypothetical protein n=1 Tax=Micromonospora sp. NPDC051300 TaxID=3364286 RepID=UPI00378D7742